MSEKSTEIEAESFAEREIKKLKTLHEIALKSRLDKKQKMRDIILHWKNLKLSQFFMKWKAMRVKYTPYQKIKMSWSLNIHNRRMSQSECVRRSLLKVNKNNFFIANMMRNISHLNKLEKRIKDENERKIKTAQVNVIRSRLRTSQEVTRRKFRSAMHNRVYSST